MKDILQQYVDARKALSEYFDAPIYHNIIILTDEKWTDYDYQHGEIAWEPLGDGDFNYSFEVYGTSRWESPDGKYTLFVGNDGCGNRDSYIFLNELRMEDAEEIF